METEKLVILFVFRIWEFEMVFEREKKKQGEALQFK
jgi:hypothetical protein